jgi:hypothetical protein
MKIPTEPIGSIPRPLSLLEAIGDRDGTDPALDPLYEEAIRDTIERFEATGSPVVTDGEQRKYHNFWTYAWLLFVNWLNCTAVQLTPKAMGQDVARPLNCDCLFSASMVCSAATPLHATQPSQERESRMG